MKPRIEPTNKEYLVPEDEFIVSKTDAKGRITYGNGTLLAATGYSEEELIGVQHNIVRHPDMPRAMFHLLWERIKNGKEYNGFVKNLRKDGGFYWVFTNVTPSVDAHGNLLGYYSVRRAVRRDALATIEPLYRDMVNAEQQAGARDAIEAGYRVLNTYLEEKGVDYDKFVFTV